MLYYNAIEKSTLELLKQLQKKDIFRQLRLAGGTSLALQMGHRISVDIDLFGVLDEEVVDINSSLYEIGQVTQLKNSKNINIYLLNGIKLDLVNYMYPWLEDVVLQDDLQLAHKNDIAAMKVAAITGRGSKKDFIDIYFLMKEITLSKIIELYQKKYHDGSLFMALKSLIFFDDAEKDEMPNMIINISWDTVKKTILAAHNDFVKHI